MYSNYREEIDSAYILKDKELLEKRGSRFPLQYILKEIDFYSIKLKVSPHVFIPRPETELLVEEILYYTYNTSFSAPIHILDLGTGTGAIILALLKEIKGSEGIGIDISEDAISLSKENAAINGIKNVSFIKGDIFYPEEFTNSEKFDIIVSNPPYIPERDMESLQEEVKYDPLISLVGGEDGLLYYRYIFKWAVKFLKNKGILGFEIGEGEGVELREIAKSYGFSNIYVRKDFNNIERVMIIWK